MKYRIVRYEDGVYYIQRAGGLNTWTTLREQCDGYEGVVLYYNTISEAKTAVKADKKRYELDVVWESEP